MPFFRRSKKEKPQRHELVDIPIGSMIELSDRTTFEMSDTPTRTFELTERKKYEGRGLLRYMYLLEDQDEQVVLGVDKIGNRNEYELTRWIIDDEDELGDPLPKVITLYYPDPDNEEGEIAVEFVRQEVVSATLTTINIRERNEYRAELHNYATQDGNLMCVEVCGNWMTFYVGETLSRTDVVIYPGEEEAEYI